MAAWVYCPPFSRTPGRIAFDVTGVVRRFIEGRCKQQDQLLSLPDQQRYRRIPLPALPARGSAAPRQHRPGLGNRIDLAFIIFAANPTTSRHHRRHADTSRHPRHGLRAPGIAVQLAEDKVPDHPSSVEPKRAKRFKRGIAGTNPARCSHRAHRHPPGSSHRSSRPPPSAASHVRPV